VLRDRLGAGCAAATRLGRLSRHLEVHPHARNQGIARALLTEAERTLRMRGYGKVLLGVVLTNASVAQLYRSRGYVEFPRPIEITAEHFLPGGIRHHVSETCHIFVNPLTGSRTGDRLRPGAKRRASNATSEAANDQDGDRGRMWTFPVLYGSVLPAGRNRIVTDEGWCGVGSKPSPARRGRPCVDEPLPAVRRRAGVPQTSQASTETTEQAARGRRRCPSRGGGLGTCGHGLVAKPTGSSRADAVGQAA